MRRTLINVPGVFCRDSIVNVNVNWRRKQRRFQTSQKSSGAGFTLNLSHVASLRKPRSSTAFVQSAVHVFKRCPARIAMACAGEEFPLTYVAADISSAFSAEDAQKFICRDVHFETTVWKWFLAAD